MRSDLSTAPFLRHGPRWWQWPTVLSLDATAVVTVWQRLFARAAGVSLPGRYTALLGAAVWLSYAADRWIEGWRLSPEDVRTQRHRFAIRFRWPLCAAWLAVLAGALALAARGFDRREWLASGLMLIPTFLYLFSHQYLHRGHPLRVPKEICIAVILAAGAALYPALMAPGAWRALRLPAALFTGLALADLLLISIWERDVDVAQEQQSLALTHLDGGRVTSTLLAVLGVAGLATGAVATGALRRLGLGTAASAALLAVLARVEPRLGRERARALVDAALLAPLLFFLT